MENKRSPGHGLGAFLAGKGFYIALSLCVVIIGVTAWAMMKSETKKSAEYPENEDAYLSDYAAAEYTPQTPEGMLSDPAWTDSVLAPDIVLPSVTELSAPAESKNEASQAPHTEAPASETLQEEAAPVWNEADSAPFSVQVFCWPINGEIENPFSADTLVFNRTMSDWRTHEGVDIAAPLGTQVMAAAGGRVEQIITDDLYGVTVVIDHTGGLRSVYANLAETPTVNVGDSVEAGEIIGAVGTTALCESAEVTHLHFAMTLDGTSVDPAEYLP